MLILRYLSRDRHCVYPINHIWLVYNQDSNRLPCRLWWDPLENAILQCYRWTAELMHTKGHCVIKETKFETLHIEFENVCISAVPTFP